MYLQLHQQGEGEEVPHCSREVQTDRQEQGLARCSERAVLLARCSLRAAVLTSGKVGWVIVRLCSKCFDHCIGCFLSIFILSDNESSIVHTTYMIYHSTVIIKTAKKPHFTYLCSNDIVVLCQDAIYHIRRKFVGVVLGIAFHLYGILFLILQRAVSIKFKTIFLRHEVQCFCILKNITMS